jgi:hypothetical protein
MSGGRFSPPRPYGEGPGVGLSVGVAGSLKGLLKRRPPHPLPPPAPGLTRGKDGEGNKGG